MHRKPRTRPTAADLAALLVGLSFAALLLIAGAVEHGALDRFSAPAPSGPIAPVSPMLDAGSVDGAAPVARVELDCWDDTSCSQPGHTLAAPADLPACADGYDTPCTLRQQGADGVTVPGPHGSTHTGCAIVLLTMEDSLAVCPDGFTAGS